MKQISTMALIRQGEGIKRAYPSEYNAALEAVKAGNLKGARGAFEEVKRDIRARAVVSVGFDAMAEGTTDTFYRKEAVANCGAEFLRRLAGILSGDTADDKPSFIFAILPGGKYVVDKELPKGAILWVRRVGGFAVSPTDFAYWDGDCKPLSNSWAKAGNTLIARAIRAREAASKTQDQVTGDILMSLAVFPTEPETTEPETTEPTKTEPETTEPTKTEPTKTEPTKTAKK